MKTTLDLPDDLLRQVKTYAAIHRQSMRVFFIDAIRARLQQVAEDDAGHRDPSWMRFVGTVPGEEAERIDAAIEEACGTIDESTW